MRFLLLLVFCSAMSLGAPRYFAIISAYNGDPRLGTPDVPAESHSWVTFVRLNAEGTHFTEKTISWGPADKKIGMLAIKPGSNWSRQETFAAAKNHSVSTIGAYEIKPSLYEAAEKQIEFLEREKVQYKIFDWNTRELAWDFRNNPDHFHRKAAWNCIHAAGDITGKPMPQDETVWGKKASEQIRDHYKDEIINFPNQTLEVLRWLK